MGLSLENGSRVCIVGGGPAGSFAALHLIHLGEQMDIHPQIFIFEPRDFNKPGPGGCNRCAGVLSSRLLKGMRALGLSLPDKVVQAEINAYAAHVGQDVIEIEQPDPRRQIISVYRGGGPRLIQGEPLASFDAYLLSEACKRGAEHVPSRVRFIDWEAGPVVHTAYRYYSADLVVIATGVNSPAPLAPSFSYRSPQTQLMAQDEIVFPVGWQANKVNAFFQHPAGLLFGALIPKGKYMNISLLGEGMTVDTIDAFIEAQGLNEQLTANPKSLCGCTPRIAIKPAPRLFGKQWVAVGDAAATRLYKDGIGSAYFTSRAAMETALVHGISPANFSKIYLPYCRRIAFDNLFGHVLYNLWKFILRNPRLLTTWKVAVSQEGNLPVEQRLHERILWGMFTGDELYFDLFKLFISTTSIQGLTRGFRHSGRLMANRRVNDGEQ
jgi:flavin-dependent dehydrogenase